MGRCPVINCPAVRDNFPSRVLLLLAQRAGTCCSNPDCRRPTSGPAEVGDAAINIGVGAHITAAATGGPRYDASLTPAERSSAANGIWLCQACGKLIDSDLTKYSTELIRGWKSAAEKRAQSLIETPRPPTDVGEPTLIIPLADPKISWLTFSARALVFLGRQREQSLLDEFLDSEQAFAWWLITGPAGVGKSRLALELCLCRRPGWSTGFLSRTESFADWSRFRPSRPTLIVIDYVASRAGDVGATVLQLARTAKFLPHPVRVLLLERDQGSWQSRFLREDSQSESAEIAACLFDDPLSLSGLGTDGQQAGSVASRGQRSA